MMGPSFILGELFGTLRRRPIPGSADECPKTYATKLCKLTLKTANPYWAEERPRWYPRVPSLESRLVNTPPPRAIARARRETRTHRHHVLGERRERRVRGRRPRTRGRGDVLRRQRAARVRRCASARGRGREDAIALDGGTRGGSGLTTTTSGDARDAQDRRRARSRRSGRRRPRRA